MTSPNGPLAPKLKDTLELALAGRGPSLASQLSARPLCSLVRMKGLKRWQNKLLRAPLKALSRLK